jgi:Ca2+-binding EF-hand superfamily protein
LLELADSEQEILEAFSCFDEHDLGFVDVGRVGPGERVDADGRIGQEGLRGWLRDYGDKMTEDEVWVSRPR